MALAGRRPGRVVVDSLRLRDVRWMSGVSTRQVCSCAYLALRALDPGRD